MKFLKKLFKVVIIFLVLIIVGGWLYSKTYHPKYSGELDIENLNEEVTIYFDEIGVPHIYAQSQRDAYVALGYVHAQDRLWQMELIRRIAPGRLSEIFGKDLLNTDVFFASLGIEEAAEKAILELDKDSDAYLMSMAYLEGINQFIRDGKTPLEFSLVGVKKEEYSLKDIYSVFGYMSFSFAIGHKTDPLLNEIKDKLGATYFNEFMGSLTSNLTINKRDIQPVKVAYAKAVHNLIEKLPVPVLIGSNSWVIAPEKTKNGKVIFANDPHIGFAQPSVWFQNHIKTPDYEIYGFNIALMPFPLLGHNRSYAYGLTMLANDDLNFYVEENHPNNPNKYKTSTGFKDYEIRTKTIKIKDAKDTIFQVKVSQHGPIMNRINKNISDSRPIATQWIYTQLKNEMLQVSHGFAHSNSLEEFRNHVAKIHAPGLNVMYGDANNNIAWFAAAKLYEMRDSISTKTYLNGVSGEDEILEFLPFDENPKAVNPAKNYVYSANHQPDSVRGKLYPGYYQPQDRSKRIEEVLEAKNNFTKDDVAKMIYDVTSSTAPKIARKMTALINNENLAVSQKKAITILNSWNGSYTKEAIAPTIYNRFLYEFLVNTFKDELGDSFEMFINTQLQDHVLPNQIDLEISVWWDDISTENKTETRVEIITKSFKNAFKFLENQLGTNVDAWQWKRVISLEHEHAIGKAGGLLRKIFNVGPFETIGGNEVINNQIFKLNASGIYKISAGPSTRRVIDFSDIKNSLSILPTGQSGNIFSAHYKDQAQKFVDGEFVKMSLNEADIKKSENVLVLKPKN